MKAVWILTSLALLTGCTPAQKKAEPAKSTAPPCHETVVMAKSDIEAPAKQEVQKQHRKFPSCPDNMRLVLPSSRELDAWYGKSMGHSDWDAQDSNDVEFSRATCVPDSFGIGK